MTDTVELTTRKAQLLREKIAQVVQDNKKSCMDLAMVLHEAYTSTVVVNGDVMHVYQFWGYGDWGSFVRTEMGIFKTTADNYRKVWRVFGIDLAGAYDQEEILPITKMKILVSADLNKKNVKSWLKKAKSMSCVELQKEIFGHDRLHNVTLKVTASEMKQIQKDIESCRELSDENIERGQIVMLALRHWTKEQKQKFGLKKVG